MAQRDKFGPRSLPGMFVGYHFAPGGIFKENYLIVDMERFLQSNGVAVPVQRVGRIVLEPGAWRFPLWGLEYNKLINEYRAKWGDPPEPLGEQEDTIPYHKWGLSQQHPWEQVYSGEPIPLPAPPVNAQPPDPRALTRRTDPLDSRALTQESNSEQLPHVIFDQTKDDAEAERIFGFSPENSKTTRALRFQ